VENGKIGRRGNRSWEILGRWGTKASGKRSTETPKKDFCRGGDLKENYAGSNKNLRQGESG